jgi:alcohol dehydrogenase class IV
MGCGHAHEHLVGCEEAFTVDASRITFGRGALAEVGPRARALASGRAALFTDRRVRATEAFATVQRSLAEAGLDVVVYDDTRVEPTDASFEDAARFAAEARPDVYVSLGGGSVIDTCKAANLYARWPAPLLDYVNAPIGAQRAVPGALTPHVACPTTCGTGAEVTGIAIFDLLSLEAKTGIASPSLRPTEAVIDPDAVDTLPAEVVAASGLDVLSHALESYTARPFTRRPRPPTPLARPMSQGANPFSDVGCREALRLSGAFLERAVGDASDRVAREKLTWAATLAGIAFGNAGVHAPHGMSYAVAGLARSFRAKGYPGEGPLVPHGMSVALSAPAVFRYTAVASPERHLECAALLGADVRGAAPDDAGRILGDRLASILRAVGMPAGLAGVGYGDGDVDALVERAHAQQRLLVNAPREMTREVLADLFRASLHA